MTGLSARHPFILEVRFPASANFVINGFRRFRAARDLEFALTSLLRGSIRSSRSGIYRWVVPAFGEDLPSTFLREGYRWPAFTAESSGFSEVHSLDPIEVLPANAYYAREPWTITSTLSVPDNLPDLLSGFYSLNQDQREAWLRGCYWLHHSSYVRAASTSAAFAALVIAVDSLIPVRAGRVAGPSRSSLASSYLTRFLQKDSRSSIGSAPTCCTATNWYIPTVSRCRSALLPL